MITIVHKNYQINYSEIILPAELYRGSSRIQAGTGTNTSHPTTYPSSGFKVPRIDSDWTTHRISRDSPAMEIISPSTRFKSSQPAVKMVFQI